MQIPYLLNPIVAHRGAWLEFNLPENSLASLEKAIEIGAGATEFDVHLTADDVLVVHHDAEFFGLNIETSTYEELSVFNLENGEKLPLVSEFLAIGLKQKNTKLVFEIKSSLQSLQRTLYMVDEVVKILNNKDYSHNLEFIMFSWEGAQYLKQKLPIYNVSYLNGDKNPKQVSDALLNGIDYNIKLYKKHLNYIADSKKLNLVLNSWTVNQPEDFEFLLNENFDMITTNKPQEFLKLYKNKKSNSY